jgi:Helix-turn-helix domain
MARHNKEPRKDRYFALHHYMLNTDAWKGLSANARAVYVQIGFRYDGFNNGRIAFSVRDAAKECGLAKDTASRALKELVDLGFIEETRHGGLSRKTRIASEWRMTAFKCDLIGALKSCLFMKRGAQASERRLARRRPQTGRRSPQPVPNDDRECPKTRYSLSQTTVSHSPECPKRRPVEAVLGGSPIPNDGTHIVYQSVVGSETTTSRVPAPVVDASQARPGGACPPPLARVLAASRTLTRRRRFGVTRRRARSSIPLSPRRLRARTCDSPG